MRPVARIAVPLVLVVASAGAYLWWNSPERQIQRTLNGLADALSHDPPATSLSAISAASAIREYFAADVVIEAGAPFSALRGRDAVLGAAARLHAAVPALLVEFVDVRIALGPDRTDATVDCTATATISNRGGQQTVDARELILTMTRVDGRWVIESAKLVEVLEPIS